MSRHAFDADHRTIHVSGNLMTRLSRVGRSGGKEKQCDDHHRHCPEDHLIQRQGGRLTARPIGHVKRPAQKANRHGHEDRPIRLNKRRHPRTGDSAQDQQGRQPTSARRDECREQCSEIGERSRPALGRILKIGAGFRRTRRRRARRSAVGVCLCW